VDTWVWILLVVAAIVLIGAIYAGTRGRERRLEARREEAGTLRERSRMRADEAHRREQLAEEQAREAKREREAAETTAQRADELDPDVDRT
jgi:FtsZ-interacting cell division protein ZipA